MTIISSRIFSVSHSWGSFSLCLLSTDCVQGTVLAWCPQWSGVRAGQTARERSSASHCRCLFLWFAFVFPVVQASILLKHVKANKISSLWFFVDQHSQRLKPQRTASPQSSSFISCSPNPPPPCETPPSVVHPSSEAENGRGGLGKGLRHSPWK